MSFATDQVALLRSAYEAVCSGQSVRYGERVLTRADAAWISSELDKWMRRAAEDASAAAGRSHGVAIADFSGGGSRSSFRRAE